MEGRLWKGDCRREIVERKIADIVEGSPGGEIMQGRL
jgi:hypothetical protein